MSRPAGAVGSTAASGWFHAGTGGSVVLDADVMFTEAAVAVASLMFIYLFVSLFVSLFLLVFVFLRLMADLELAAASFSLLAARALSASALNCG